ncbi:monovalent cation/H(+) antiporter subunit G [Streptomyces sp. NPDC091371]|uniref:monovalent cation/H(+) antiporter subunit G n=1 Tax=Streptomyces sp. NPDC091371 TaxID=3155303 RepID=UPI00343859A8
MDPRTVCAAALLAAGSAVLLLAVAAFLALPRPYARLHALAPATSLGAPLVLLALAVDAPPGRAAVKFLVIAVLMVLGGTLTTPAVGRVTAEHEGRLPGDAGT